MVIDFIAYKNAKEEEKRRIKTEMLLTRELDCVHNAINELDGSIATSIIVNDGVKTKEVIIDRYVLETMTSALREGEKELKEALSKIRAK